ncbi:S9 family peptidase [Nocardia sp. BMG111209]|uniref:alpha/beta hydrolase family protein n=1 Tax=Nocardia sp. BMG111209 TaxID=1160137 RepID=UPI000374F9A9|nr:alpha/beta hydrolase [Nocardia sp. BMG111209]
MSTGTRALVTLCTLTGTTEWVARRCGTRPLVPDVSVRRFAGWAGTTPDRFAGQLDRVRSFTDAGWSGHWSRIAERHMATADGLLAELATATGTAAPTVAALLAPDHTAAVADLGRLLAPAAGFVADRGAERIPRRTERFARSATAGAAIDEHAIWAARAADALLTAIGYDLIAAWPGHTPARMAAHLRSQRLLLALLTASAPGLGCAVETVDIPSTDGPVRIWTIFPSGESRCPTVLVTNGLDGTAQELVLSLLRYRHTGIGFAVMEMPGAYAVGRPSTDPVRDYAAVLDRLVAHPRVDGSRIGMFGLSFGGYWSARMAATDPRLRCAVAAGPPVHRSFGATGVVGVPEVLLRAMIRALGAGGAAAMGTKLRALSLKRSGMRIEIPLLVVNGAADTVTDVRDSVWLATRARHAVLWLYSNDDHCAMEHFGQWLTASIEWLRTTLR